MIGFDLAVASALLVVPPLADEPCEDERWGVSCDTTEGGVLLRLEAVIGLSDAYPDPDDSGPDAASWYEYRWMWACPGNSWEDPMNVLCDFAVAECANADPTAPGPYSRIARRSAGEVETPWAAIGGTCWPEAVPARSGDSVGLTEEMLIAQFHQTDFAPPVMSAQPPDGQALVHMPVYFQVEWGDGFGPGDVDSTTLLGHDIRIRPMLIDVTYAFGDGATLGPTESTGGPWPNSDVTHAYTSGQTVLPYATVTYGGEVSVDGEDWWVLPASTDITGPGLQIEVRTSTNRLTPSPSG